MSVLAGIGVFLLGTLFGAFATFCMFCLCVAASDRDRKNPPSKEDWHGLD